MSVTAETARKAVDRWNLDGGHAVTLRCGCRGWVHRTPEHRVMSSRHVYTCPDHRPPWEDSHPGFLYAHS